MLSRRLVLPAMGALALMVSAGAVWKAEAQGSGFTVQITNATNPVPSGGAVTVTGTASTNVGRITSVTARLVGGSSATVNNPGQSFSLQLRAPVNNGKSPANVRLTVTARRSAGNPRSKNTSMTLRVLPRGGGGHGGGHDPNQPPPPPNI